MSSVKLASMLLFLFLAQTCAPFSAAAQALSPNQQQARDIYKELVEINTVTPTGDTAKAADAMAARLRAAGFAGADVQVFNPAPRKGNLVARLHGTGARKPILLMAHLDVVEARRDDWSVDPFKLVEQDGWFYGRGTGDDKFMATAFLANLIRYKQEGYRPERDIILALETDEEILDRNVLGLILRRSGRRAHWASLPLAVLVVNAAFLVGWVNVLRGRRIGAWHRTDCHVTRNRHE